MTKILSKTAPQSSAENSYLIAALYHFVPLEEIHEWQQKFIHICTKNHLFGTILIAHEGINGTIAGHPSEITEFVTWLYSQPEFKQTHIKYSEDSICPFHRMKVRLKKEIVTMGEPDINPAETKGVYVKPEDWNSLISSPDVLVVDTRNDYEVAIGKFAKAINPKTTSFREFPKWADDFASENQKAKPSKVAMYCTGGIRCEKSTSYLKSLGFEDVYHLEGGILKYLEKTPESESQWDGSCFVFDYRVSVEHNLKLGKYDMCFACRMPISEDDKESEYFIQGESCHHCFNTSNDKQKKRFKERQKQIELSKVKKISHIGPIE